MDTGPAAPLDEVDGFVYEAMRDAELVLEIATTNRPLHIPAGRPGAHEIAVTVHVVRDPAGKGTLARPAETTGGVTGRPEHRHMRPAAHRLVAGNR